MSIKGDLSMRQINQLKKEFLALSDNGNGTISVNELDKLLREVKKRNNIPERDIARILANADKDGSGEIEVHEFLQNCKIIILIFFEYFIFLLFI